MSKRPQSKDNPLTPEEQDQQAAMMRSLGFEIADDSELYPWESFGAPEEIPPSSSN